MKERQHLVDKSCSLSIRRQSKLLSLCRSSFYSLPKGESKENLELMLLMDKHHLDHPTKGVLQMQDYLRLSGYRVNEKRVRRLMRLMRIEALYPKRNLSKLGLSKYIKPYLLKGLDINEVNQAWALDITYIAMQKGFMYLSAIIDIYSRYVVGWNLSNSLDASVQTQLVNDSIASNGTPTIINSDQGSQYTCPGWERCLQSHGIKISMDGRGRATDNAHIERLWRSVKQEYVYLNPEENINDLYMGFKEYFTYYNEQRTHQGIGRKIPKELYFEAKPSDLDLPHNHTLHKTF